MSAFTTSRASPEAARGSDRLENHWASGSRHRLCRLTVTALPVPPTTAASDGRAAATSARIRGLGFRVPTFALMLFMGDALAFVGSFAINPVYTRAHPLQFIVLVVIYAWLGLYTSRLSLSVLDDLPRLAGGAGIAAAISVTVSVLHGEGIADFGLLSRAILLAVGAVLVRAIGYATLRRLRTLGLTTRRAVIIGADQVGLTLANRLQDHPEHGLRVIGFVDAEPPLHRPGADCATSWQSRLACCHPSPA